MRFITYKIFKSCSLFLLLLVGCKDIIEEDLSPASVALIAPQDSLITTTLSHTFLWEELEAALQYELQIAVPSFDNLERFVLDTTLTSDRLFYTLNPGHYQWRVKATNGSSETLYTTHTLTVDSTPDLSGQQVIISTPDTYYVTNDTALTFRWYDNLYSADQYSFQIRTPDWSGSQYLPEVITTADTVHLANIADGQYEWGVRAENNLSNTPYSIRFLWVDATAPTVPTLLSPANNSTFPDTVITFTWNRVDDAGTAIQDSFYVYSDTVSYTVVRSGITPNEQHLDSLWGTGDFFWRVRSIDEATNSSNYSTLRTFTIQ